MGTNNSYPEDSIWCVIPVLNNKDTVEDIARGCRSYLRQVLVIDDGSSDIDVSALFLGSDVVVLKHEQNRGKGEAILTALRYIKAHGGRFMITIDADGQHYPRDIGKFLPLLRDDTCMVVGCRNFQGEHIPKKSRFGRRLSNFWLKVETGVSINDCQSGFRAYPIRYLSQIKLNGSHYDFETEVLTRMIWAGLKVKTVPIEVWYPQENSQRISSFRPFLDNLRISLMHARLVGRRLLPIPDRKLIRSNEKHTNWKSIFHPLKLIKTLLKENATPGGLALAAAVGIFLGVLPLISIHTIVIIYVASRLHLNKVMAVAIQNLCIPPFVPVICIELGHYMLYGKWITDASLKTIFGQLPDRLWEWFLGSIIIAPLAAVVMGVSIYFIANTLKNKTRLKGHGKD